MTPKQMGRHMLGTNEATKSSVDSKSGLGGQIICNVDLGTGTKGGMLTCQPLQRDDPVGNQWERPGNAHDSNVLHNLGRSSLVGQSPDSQPAPAGRDVQCLPVTPDGRTGTPCQPAVVAASVQPLELFLETKIRFLQLEPRSAEDQWLVPSR